MENKKPIIAIVVLSVLCLILFIAYMGSLAKVKNSDDNIALATENEELTKENKLLQSEVTSLTNDKEQLQAELNSAKDALKKSREGSVDVADSGENGQNYNVLWRKYKALESKLNTTESELENTKKALKEAREASGASENEASNADNNDTLLSYDDLDYATKNAYSSAKDWLELKAFSKKGLIKRLSGKYGDGYTEKQAQAAIEFLENQGEVNWKKEAVRDAKEWLDMMAFSRKKLIERLSGKYGDGFTQKQAEYAADQVGLTE